jgi:hypothetical protein
MAPRAPSPRRGMKPAWCLDAAHRPRRAYQAPPAAANRASPGARPPRPPPPRGRDDYYPRAAREGVAGEIGEIEINRNTPSAPEFWRYPKSPEFLGGRNRAQRAVWRVRPPSGRRADRRAARRGPSGRRPPTCTKRLVGEVVSRNEQNARSAAPPPLPQQPRAQRRLPSLLLLLLPLLLLLLLLPLLLLLLPLLLLPLPLPLLLLLLPSQEAQRHRDAPRPTAKRPAAVA